MTKKLLALSLLPLLGAGCLSSTTPPSSNNTTPPPTPISTTPLPATSTPPVPETPTSTVMTGNAEAKKDLIVVTNVTSSQKIKNKFVVKGKARGNWYFEASFPYELRDGNNVVLAQGAAQAQGNWMTTNFVPFSFTLTFTTPTTTTGTLILKKDNPSGLPANDDQLVIPVTF